MVDLQQPQGQAFQPKRPTTDLDYNLMVTDPVVGTENVNPKLKEQFDKDFYITDARGHIMKDVEGNLLYSKENMWEKLNFYTRDMRLGNLSNEELEYCQWYLDFASDLLQDNMFESFIVALSRAVTVIELSQSKKGFLRKQPNTLRTESAVGDLEPAKPKIFGGKKN